MKNLLRSDHCISHIGDSDREENISLTEFTSNIWATPSRYRQSIPILNYVYVRVNEILARLYETQATQSFFLSHQIYDIVESGQASTFGAFQFLL